jgi:cobalt-zinc-cadmium efflux system outer membrane protein
MWLRLAALAVFAAVPCVNAQTRPPVPSLTLDDAIARVASTHPDLRLVDGQRAVLQAQATGAALRPPLSIGVELENALGSGQARALDQAELTVTLAGVLERGGKLDARRALAQANIDALAPQREITRLDLLAEVARRYLDISVAMQQRAIALDDIGQRQRTLVAARQRLQAGASPESVPLTAQAALAQAELDRDRADEAIRAARRSLAALWGARDPGFDTVTGDPLTLPALEEFDALAEWLERTPEVAQLAGQVRVQEAQLRLAQSQRRADLQWQVGVRQLREGNDTALVGGFSLPLGSARRAAPELQAAQAQLAMGGVQRASLQLQLYSTLAQAHGRYVTARLEVTRMARDVLPPLARAETAAERAWRAGAISYMEWAQLQAQRIEARQRQLDAAVQAQSALIELQRLTGQASVAAATSKDATP